jgi:serine/threonine-protein kinase
MIGRLIDGRYQVRSRIARGGMATVYLATDLRLERRVAVKVMHGHLADDSQFKQRFIQEARSAARLAHPNVVNVFDQGQDQESAYLVMEYLPGITLRELLEEYGSLTPQQMLDITEAVLSGLSAAHKAGILHRDLKPENVLLADDGRIKIGDFGLARATSANTATGTALLGTIAYLSPELVTRGVADTRSDIYAVGIMMYEMLTGEQPFTGEQPMQIAYRHANEPVPAPSAKNPKVPRELDELVLWATAKDPEHRPVDALTLLEELRGTEALLELPATPPARAQKTQVLPAAPSRRHTGPTDTASTPALRPERPGSDLATQVLGPRRGAGREIALADPATSQPRRRRWIALVAALGALLLLGSGAGWWFAFGPGARVTIPDQVAGMSPDEARTFLTDLGLDVDPQTGEAFSVDVAVGAVAETDPAIGESVDKGSTVRLLISKGPQPIDIAFARGMPREDAESIVEQDFTLKTIDEQFNADVEEDTLIDALAADGTTSLIGVATYGEQQEITLVISAGPVPDVANQPLEAAKSLLEGVGLIVDPNVQQDFSDDIPAGSVIGLAAHDEPLRPDDTVVVILSEGPAPVNVPDIVGLTWTEARDALLNAGLKFAFARNIDRVLAESAPDEATVTSVDPDEGTQVHRTDTVTVRLGT